MIIRRVGFFPAILEVKFPRKIRGSDKSNFSYALGALHASATTEIPSRRHLTSSSDFLPPSCASDFQCIADTEPILPSLLQRGVLILESKIKDVKTFSRKLWRYNAHGILFNAMHNHWNSLAVKFRYK